MTEDEFGTVFGNLTGNKPFPWQWDLYDRWFAEGNFPRSCNIPTGLGKTSIVAVWLIALAHHPDKVPRRLVYVVNRRTVVDQTTDEVQKLRKNLCAAGLSVALSNLAALGLDEDQPPLALSTLRGAFADNREWSADPARPAVISGTVDMIGSRLLFSGYGIGFRGKPLHAGFLAQDVLLVHDEAHLEPAFQELLAAMQTEQRRCNDFRKFRVIELSATSRSGRQNPNDDTFELTELEKNIPAQVPHTPTEPLHIAWRRLAAAKAIQLISVDDERKQLAEKIADLVLEPSFKDSKAAILVFAQTVENVEKIVARLNKAKQRVQQLTGTLRGLERDRLPADSIFRRFLPNAEADGTTVYLVCTSAGEVGVNLSADHLVCDLTTFESMAQRFGRVNRFGHRTDTEIRVVYPRQFDEVDEYERRRGRTLQLLQQLNGDGSPAALARLGMDERIAAFAPEPTVVPVSDILFDSWSLTTIRGNLPGRPPVEPYLRGISERDPPETRVAWREEVGLITGPLLQAHGPKELLEDYPLKPHETLRDRSIRVLKHLALLAERYPSAPAWLVGDDGSIDVFTLGALSDKDFKDRLNGRTVLLSPDVGGLRCGLLDGSSATASDVADEWFEDDDRAVRRRVRVLSSDPCPAGVAGMRLIREIDAKPESEDDEESGGGEAFNAVEQGEKASTGRYWRWYTRPRSADDDGSKTSQEPISWDDHTNQVTCYTGRIVSVLGLPPDLQDAIRIAARFHDLGKKRKLWQRSIGNPEPSNWLAKSGNGMRPLETSDYRHEFGSLIDVYAQVSMQREAEFNNLSDPMKDIALHLIAAHHGRARPHFPSEEAFDDEPNGQDVALVAAEVPRRFARLQRAYGRWGLAYLESLLRAADYAASARPLKLEQSK